MIPVYQTIVDEKRGDCMRATIASLFDLRLEQVPDFTLFDDVLYWRVFHYFVFALGYDNECNGYPDQEGSIPLCECPTVDGAIYASVQSRTFKSCWHAVLIDSNGVVLHDPNPNKAFLGVNVVETKELCCWHQIRKRTEEAQNGS